MKSPLHTTWLILRDGSRVLLGHKKTGFGRGKINGIGGKVEPGESIEQAAVRETAEEIGVTVTTYEKVAHITFDNLDYNGYDQQVIMHCFVATSWQGTPTESIEITPEWFEINKIPYEKMWADDAFWVPQILAGKSIKARFKLDSQTNKILSHTIKVMLK